MLFNMLWANSADDKLTKNFLIFLLGNRLGHSMQIVSQGDSLHANCLPRRQFAWNVKSCFLGEIRKYFKMFSAEIFTQYTKC